MDLHEYNIIYKSMCLTHCGTHPRTQEKRVRAITAQSAVNYAFCALGAIQVTGVERIEVCTDWSNPK